MRPLVVYLDSSDFSRFGDLLAGRGKHGDADLLVQLEKYRDEGIVDFRYSYIHIVEAAPTTDDALTYARERAVAILRVCGKKALAVFWSLPLIDAAGALREPQYRLPRDRLQFNGRNDNGQWFPTFRDVFEHLTSSLKEMYEDPLSVAQKYDPEFRVNRAFRRKAKKNTSPKAVAQTFARDLPNLWPSYHEKLLGHFPISAETSRLWQRHMLGKAKLDDMTAAIARDLSFLPAVMDWLVPSGTSPLREVPAWLRNGAAGYEAVIASGRASREAPGRDLITLGGEQRAKKLWADTMVGKRAQLENGFLAQICSSISTDVATIQALGVNPGELSSFLSEKWIAGFPSQQTLVEAILWGNDKNTSPFENEKKIEKVGSDFGDMLHAAYLPYVDLMRVDGHSVGYLKKAALIVNTTLVDKLHKLPAAIASKLSEVA